MRGRERAAPTECPPGSPTPGRHGQRQDQRDRSTRRATCSCAYGSRAAPSTRSTASTRPASAGMPASRWRRGADLRRRSETADAPGTLTVTADARRTTTRSRSCTVSGTVSFEIGGHDADRLEAAPAARRSRGTGGWLWDSDVLVLGQAGADGRRARRSPSRRAPSGGRAFRGRARARSASPSRCGPSRRPGARPGARTASCAYDRADLPARASGPGLNGAERRVRSPRAAARCRAARQGADHAPARGHRRSHYSAHEDSDRPRRQGAQDGAPIARLRMAGRCDPRGQFSQCRFKKLSTAL